jgi:uncharacterized protein YegP (UPF0339 family)
VSSKFRLKAANGEVAATDEAYETKAAARKGAKRCREPPPPTIIEVD